MTRILKQLHKKIIATYAYPTGESRDDSFDQELYIKQEMQIGLNLLAADVPATERSTSYLGTNTHFVNDHQDALDIWERQLNKQPGEVTLLHVDTHSDFKCVGSGFDQYLSINRSNFLYFTSFNRDISKLIWVVPDNLPIVEHNIGCPLSIDLQHEGPAEYYILRDQVIRESHIDLNNLVYRLAHYLKMTPDEAAKQISSFPNFCDSQIFEGLKKQKIITEDEAETLERSLRPMAEYQSRTYARFPDLISFIKMHILKLSDLKDFQFTQPVILDIDMDYFSNKGFDTYKRFSQQPTLQELNYRLEHFTRTITSLNLDVGLTTISRSWGYVPIHDVIAREQYFRSPETQAKSGDIY